MTDNKKRRRIDLQKTGQGKSAVTSLVPVPVRSARVKFLKKDRFTVGKLNHPIDDAALQEALAGFP
jgi:hypothetical protein